MSREPLEVCNALVQWAKVADVESPRAGKGYLAIAKSNLLSRLLYGGESGPSQTPCPVHKGHWAGIQSGWPGREWYHADGTTTPVDVEPRLQEQYDAGCRCAMHKGTSNTTGWNPDEHCGCTESFSTPKET